MYKTALNTTDQVVVIDSDGRSLGGYEYGAVNPDDSLVVEAISTGKLRLITKSELNSKDVDPQAKLVDQQTSSLNPSGPVIDEPATEATK